MPDPYMLMIRGSERINPIRILVSDNVVANLRSTYPLLDTFAVANQALEFVLFQGAICFGNLAPENKHGHRHSDHCDNQCLFDGSSLHVSLTQGRNDDDHAAAETDFEFRHGRARRLAASNCSAYFDADQRPEPTDSTQPTILRFAEACDHHEDDEEHEGIRTPNA